MEQHIPQLDQTAPDFRVDNSNGDPFEFHSSLLQSDNTILVFYRGHW